MYILQHIVDWLDAEYPVATAEDWDNVGLLVGDLARPVSRIMTCLTVTPIVCAEAAREAVDLLVSHHPFPFRPVKRITSDSVEGRMLLDLIGAGRAVYSPHTAHDSAPDGVNAQLADLLGLQQVRALNENGSGRIGVADGGQKLSDLIARVEESLGRCSYVGDPARSVERVAVGCGAADDFVAEAARQGADLLLLGEARFHTCLLAESLDLALILPGHFASERFAVRTLAMKIAAKFPDVDCFASRTEQDVLRRR